MERNELSASPQVFANMATHERPSNEIERIPTASSTSTSSSTDTARLQERSISRASTQGDLERHPTVLSRIHTAKSQHNATVGRQRSMSTRTRDTRRPLPEMGLGKPYPPPLPARDEYVVEFEGPDDPLHAQNWPMKKKYVQLSLYFPLTTIQVLMRSV